MFGLSAQEFVIVGVIAILLFGKRLPEVARNVGAKYREFRKGLSEIQSSLNVSDFSVNSLTAPYKPSSSSSGSGSAPASSGSYSEYDDYDEPTAPKFEPPPSEPHLAANSPQPATESPQG
jgi:sec-independent protein translocase protein TatA